MPTDAAPAAHPPPSPSVYWQARRRSGPARPLEGEARADVAIVGGGILGLACAKRLLEGGVRAVLVERELCGAAASGRSSGFVTPASELDLHSLCSTHGAAEARRIWEFASSGVEALRASIQGLGLACDFEPQDSLFVANGARGGRAVEEEHAARAALGFESAHYARGEVRRALGTDSYGAAVRYGGTFAIDPHAYCRELAAHVERGGVRVHEHTPVVAVEPGRVVLARGALAAERIVVCTDRFIPELGALRDEIFHVQTFLAITAPLAARELERIFPSGKLMVWDSDLLYHYLRATPDGRLLLGGAALSQTYASAPPDSLASAARKLGAWFAARFPDPPIRLEHVWSGMLGVSKDLLPVMGADPRDERVWYCGAATGLPWGTALGIYAAERILSGRSDFDAAFSPRRKVLIGPRLQRVLGKPLSYAICNGAAKLR